MVHEALNSDNIFTLQSANFQDETRVTQKVNNEKPASPQQKSKGVGISGQDQIAGRSRLFLLNPFISEGQHTVQRAYTSHALDLKALF